MELTSYLGNLTKPGSSNFGNNFSFIWVFLILLLSSGDGLGTIFNGFYGNKKHYHHKKRGSYNILDEDNLFILFIVFALFYYNNKEQNC